MGHWPACALALLALAMGGGGCGGGSGSGGRPQAQVENAIVGRIEWPAALGAVSGVEVRVRGLSTGQGATGDTLATGTVDAAAGTYRVGGFRVDRLVMVEALGSTPAGRSVRLGAVVLPAQSPGRQEVQADIGGATTLACEAVQQLLRGGAAAPTITPGVVSNLQAATAHVADSVDFSDYTSISDMARAALVATGNGATAAAGSATGTIQ